MSGHGSAGRGNQIAGRGTNGKGNAQSAENHNDTARRENPFLQFLSPSWCVIPSSERQFVPLSSPDIVFLDG